MNAQQIKLSDLHLNSGQVPGVPKNPRFIRDERFEKLVGSIKDHPEMLELRELIAVEHQGKYVVIAGNMRLRALRELGYKHAPVKALPADTEAAKLRAYAIKDNVSFGQDDWDALANEWDTEELSEWGMDTPDDWAGGEEQKGAVEGDWSDDGVADVNQYGVIVICADSVEQEKIFNWLSAEGHKCKIVVT